jgi:hypothetical protein
MQNFLAELVDVALNGRSAAEATGESNRTARAQVAWPELIKRKRSYLLIGGKTYRVTVEPVKLKAEARRG